MDTNAAPQHVTDAEIFRHLHGEGLHAARSDLSAFEYFGLIWPESKVLIGPTTNVGSGLGRMRVNVGDDRYTRALTAPRDALPPERNSRIDEWIDHANTSTAGSWTDIDTIRQRWTPSHEGRVLELTYLSTDLSMIAGLVKSTTLHLNALTVNSALVRRALPDRIRALVPDGIKTPFIEDGLRFFRIYMAEYGRGGGEQSDEDQSHCGRWARVETALARDPKLDPSRYVEPGPKPTKSAKQLLERCFGILELQIDALNLESAINAGGLEAFVERRDHPTLDDWLMTLLGQRWQVAPTTLLEFILARRGRPKS